MAVAAAIKVAKRAAPDDIVVVFNPDSGRGYLSRVFDDEWMANYGFLRECDQCVGAVLDTRSPTLDSLLYVSPNETVRVAIERMRANGVSQLPVCKNTPPFAAAEISGSVDELELMEAIFREPSVMDTAVEKVMGPKLPTIGVGQQLEQGDRDAGDGTRPARAVGGATVERAHPHRHPVVLRGGCQPVNDRG